MATHTFDLEDGINLGGVPQKKCVLRSPGAQDLIEASAESERVVMVGDDPALVPSPAMTSVNTLRRQVVSIGDISGPLEMHNLFKLSDVDLIKLEAEADKLKAATLSVSQRGRPDEAGPADGTDD